MSIELPSLQELQMLSFPVCQERSTARLKVTPDILTAVKSDIMLYRTMILNNKDIQKYNYRIKSKDSISQKVERYPNKPFRSVFNDLLSIRVITNRYPCWFPGCYRVADLSTGKAVDDGYRAVHLYYKQDNHHYPIEVQIWEDEDAVFNAWSHTKLYKRASADTIKKYRDQFDAGELDLKLSELQPEMLALQKEYNKFCVIKEFEQEGSVVFPLTMATERYAQECLRFTRKGLQVTTLGGPECLQVYSEYAPYTIVDGAYAAQMMLQGGEHYDD